MVEHGGTDLGPAVAWDFSTNANPLPPPEGLSMALAGADRRRYPEPSYLHLRERLARSGLGDADRLLPTAGSAEAIRRLTLLAHLQGVRHVWTPWPGFGEYAAAAEALGLTVSRYSSVEELARRVSARRAAGERATMLLWVCDPCHPTDRLLHLAPSWVLSAEGVALLQAWCEPEVRDWLGACAQQLATWCDEMAADLQALGWSLHSHLPADVHADHEGPGPMVPFLLAKPPAGEGSAQVLQRCRAAGIRLRDASSLGLPSWLRLRAHVPQARLALLACLRNGQQVVQA